MSSDPDVDTDFVTNSVSPADATATTKPVKLAWCEDCREYRAEDHEEHNSPYALANSKEPKAS